MLPDTQRARLRSMGVLDETSCGRARFGSPGKLAEKFVYAPVAERVDHEGSKRFRSETNDVRPGQRAFRELYRRTGRRCHDVSFLFTGLECVLDLGDGSSPGLTVCLQLVQRDAHGSSSRLRGGDRLGSAEYARR